MTIRQLCGWVLLITGGGIILALVVGALMSTASGFLPIAALAVVWWAQDLPTFDIDAELHRLLTEA